MRGVVVSRRRTDRDTSCTCFRLLSPSFAAILVVALDQVTKIAAEQFLADTPQQSASSVRFEIVTTLTPGSGDSLFHLAQG